VDSGGLQLVFAKVGIAFNGAVAVEAKLNPDEETVSHQATQARIRLAELQRPLDSFGPSVKAKPDLQPALAWVGPQVNLAEEGDYPLLAKPAVAEALEKTGVDSGGLASTQGGDERLDGGVLLSVSGGVRREEIKPCGVDCVVVQL
jgi:hypothetical protein